MSVESKSSHSLVTVMIATYNQPDYIYQAVSSALSQSYPFLEVIVSDDSTNDETKNILSAFGNDPRFVYYKNSRQLGRVANYRRLVHELANGRWVVMLDGDDYYSNDDYIQKAMDVASAHPDVVLVGANIRIMNEETGESYLYGLGDNNLLFEGKDVFSVYQKLPNHQTDLYLRDLARSLDFYRDPSMASDSESLYRLCLNGKVAFIADEVAVWRVHGNNITYQRDIQKQINEAVFIEKVYQYSLNFLGKELADKWKIQMYRSVALHLIHLALKAKRKEMVLRVLLKFGKYLGPKLSFVFLFKSFGFYK